MSQTLSDSYLRATFNAAPAKYFILDSSFAIRFCNEPAARLVGAEDYRELEGQYFYEPFKKLLAPYKKRPQGPKPLFCAGNTCFCPLHNVKQNPDVQQRTLLEIPSPDCDDDKARYYELIATRAVGDDGESIILVSLYNVTPTIREQRYSENLIAASLELHQDLDGPNKRGLSRDELRLLLAKRIRQHFKRHLGADAFEMRLCPPRDQAPSSSNEDEKTKKKELQLFLTTALGENLDVYKKPVYAEPTGSGITGYAADSKETYTCDDARNDPNYQVGGILNASCSITSPILYGKSRELLGVVNIESATANAFGPREKKYLELYLNELARVLNRTQILADERAQAFANCAQQLRQNLYAASLADFQQKVEACASQRPLNETEELETRAYLRGLRDAFRSSTANAQALASQWEREPAAPKETEKFADLRGLRVLLVDRDLDFLQTRAQAYQAYGLVVDVATNSKVALEMLYMFDYDLVVCELFPDGEYLEKTEEKGEQETFTPADIHREIYKTPPTEVSSRDTAIRDRVLQEIAGGKLDAYFLYAVLQDKTYEHATQEFLGFRAEWRRAHPTQRHHRTPKPLFFVFLERDPTHTAVDFNLHFGYDKTNLILKSLAPEDQLSKIQKAVGKSDA